MSDLCVNVNNNGFDLIAPPNPDFKVQNISKSSEAKKYDYITKIIMIGDGGVGKSSILRMFAESKFNEDSVSTMGIDFQVAFMKVTNANTHYLEASNKALTTSQPPSTFSHDSGCKNILKQCIFKFQVWDCAGQERFHSIIKSYIRGAHIVMYIFDITDTRSFDKLDKWKQSVEDEIGKPSDSGYIAVVVGNKLDMESKRVVSKYDGIKFASDIGTFYIEVSAKSDTNVEKMFEEIAKVLYAQTLNGTIKLTHRTQLDGTVNIISTTTQHTSYDDTNCLPAKCTIM